ncbi:uncharacterized protein LOC133804867 [Humulus lupulus]|uniref:uncharacterized protein LOC133804867 n=1 Tax=Humulus lupulus TaxID=3486 RepID=UPI002B4134D3|nr:uncharacterized protein LOC133804867 [Humulus lupulus]
MLDEIKEYVKGIMVKQVKIKCILEDMKKDVDGRFVAYEKSIKSYIDVKVEEGLTLYLDIKFNELKDALMVGNVAEDIGGESHGVDDESDNDHVVVITSGLC